jgi:hypothetical protein
MADPTFEERDQPADRARLAEPSGAAHGLVQRVERWVPREDPSPGVPPAAMASAWTAVPPACSEATRSRAAPIAVTGTTHGCRMRTTSARGVVPGDRCSHDRMHVDARRECCDHLRPVTIPSDDDPSADRVDVLGLSAWFRWIRRRRWLSIAETSGRGWRMAGSPPAEATRGGPPVSRPAVARSDNT